MENTLAQKSDLREFIPEMFYFPDLYFNENELKFETLIDGEEIDTVLVYEKGEEKFKKYEFLSQLRNYLEFGKLQLNKWINLIFGITQKLSNDKKLYFEDSMYIHFDEEEQQKDMDNFLIMQKYEFGIQPYQLLDKKFPELKDKSQYFQEIKNYNIEQFKNEHTIITGDKNKYFKCEGYNNIYPDYIEIINKKILNKNIFNKIFRPSNNDNDKHSKLKENFITFFFYIFAGDVLGNITIYKYKINNDNEINNSGKNKSKDKGLEYDLDSNYKKIKKLTDHTKQIKYIDYNRRLNLFLSYSFDGFINIYVFPKCKLVRAIKVINLTHSNEILQKVVLVSNPFPMIFAYDINNMYTFTLNGELIKKELKTDNIEILPCIDKNCGLINDCIFIKKNNDLNNEMEEISFPLLLNKNINI